MGNRANVRAPVKRPRFQVTECEGWAIHPEMRATGSGTQAGLSVQVVDTHACYRIIESWRTEEYGRGGKGGGNLTNVERRNGIRLLACELADRLNAGDRQKDAA
jgi:hypothetical protein